MKSTLNTSEKRDNLAKAQRRREKMEKVIRKFFWGSFLALFLIIVAARLFLSEPSEALVPKEGRSVLEVISEEEEAVATAVVDELFEAERAEIDKKAASEKARQEWLASKFERLFKAVAEIESGKSPKKIGDHGRAVGIVQIWKQAVDDVNWVAGHKRFAYQDRFDPAKSKEMFKIYLEYYGREYLKKEGKLPTEEIYAKIWNGGPEGYRRAKTAKYWQRVKQELGQP